MGAAAFRLGLKSRPASDGTREARRSPLVIGRKQVELVTQYGGGMNRPRYQAGMVRCGESGRGVWTEEREGRNSKDDCIMLRLCVTDPNRTR